MRNASIRIAAVLVHLVLLGIAYHLMHKIFDCPFGLFGRRYQQLPQVEMLLPTRRELPAPKPDA